MNSRSLRRSRRRARVKRLFLMFTAVVAIAVVASWAAKSLNLHDRSSKTLTLHADVQSGDRIVYRYSDYL